MPIFGRRQLQRMLDELGPWLERGKAKDLLNRLENEKPKITRSNAIIKFRDQTDNIRYQKHIRMFRLFTNSPTKRRIFVDFVFFRVSR